MSLYRYLTYTGSINSFFFKSETNRQPPTPTMVSTEEEKSTKKLTVPPANVNHLEGLSSSELSMIHRLAGNDPEVRKKTIRKLKKWLTAIAKKVPDAAGNMSPVFVSYIVHTYLLHICAGCLDV